MRLHPLSIFTGFFVALRQFGSVVLVVIVSQIARGGENIGRASLLLALSIAVPLVLTVASALVRYASTTYKVTPTDVLFNTGLIWKRRRVIPRERVQEVHLTQNLLQRVLGLTQVKVESAAGGEAEIVLDSLGTERAEELRNELTGARGPQFYQRPEPHPYEVSTGRIVLASMLENRALLLLAGALGVVMPFLEDEDFTNRIIPFVAGLGRSIEPLRWVGIAVSVYLAGWLFSGVLGIWNFAGFRIERHPKGFQVVYGLGNRTQRVMRTERIQELTVAQGVMFRLFGLYAIRAKSAGVAVAKNEAGGFGYLSPAATANEVPVLCELAMPGMVPLDQGPWRRLPSRAIPATALAALLGWAVFIADVAVLLSLDRWLDLGKTLTSVLVGTRRYAPIALASLTGIGVAGAALTALLVRHRSSGRQFARRSGRLWRAWQAVPANRTQMVAVEQSPLQRWFRLCTVSVRVAASECRVNDVSPEDAAGIRDFALAARRADPQRGI